MTAPILPAGGSRPLRVALLDDHPVVLSGLTVRLSSELSLEIVGIYERGRLLIQDFDRAFLSNDKLHAAGLKFPDTTNSAADCPWAVAQVNTQPSATVILEKNFIRSTFEFQLHNASSPMNPGD